MSTTPLKHKETDPRNLFRFISYIRVAPNGCWIWAGTRNRKEGYGQFLVDGRLEYAHRFSYELFRDPVPPGKMLDHLCCDTACTNPWHLEPVTPGENYQRWKASLGAGKHGCGHPAHAANTTPSGRCRCCTQVATYRYQLDVLKLKSPKVGALKAILTSIREALAREIANEINSPDSKFDPAILKAAAKAALHYGPEHPSEYKKLKQAVATDIAPIVAPSLGVDVAEATARILIALDIEVFWRLATLWTVAASQGLDVTEVFDADKMQTTNPDGFAALVHEAEALLPEHVRQMIATLSEANSTN